MLVLIIILRHRRRRAWSGAWYDMAFHGARCLGAVIGGPGPSGGIITIYLALKTISRAGWLFAWQVRNYSLRLGVECFGGVFQPHARQLVVSEASLRNFGMLSWENKLAWNHEVGTFGSEENFWGGTGREVFRRNVLKQQKDDLLRLRDDYFLSQPRRCRACTRRSCSNAFRRACDMPPTESMGQAAPTLRCEPIFMSSQTPALLPVFPEQRHH